jgi:hypothetical protein
MLERYFTLYPEITEEEVRKVRMVISCPGDEDSPQENAFELDFDFYLPLTDSIAASEKAAWAKIRGIMTELLKKLPGGPAGT